MFRYILAASAAVLLSASFIQPANAEVMASGHKAGQCLDMRNGVEAILWSCHGAGNQSFAFRSGSYGELLVGGRCLSTTGGAGSGIVAGSCNGSRGQKWTITSAGALRNEEGWCADVERGGGQGSRVIAWQCSGSSNQRWGFSRFVSAVQAASQGLLSSSAVSAASGARAGSVINSNGVVSAGGANAVAAGGANVVAAGGGNILVPMVGVVAAGGLN
ncbi:MAG: ricin-type beta-trefoil lectin domain protein [Parvibaculum sp.]|uniref:ricin-type beta-trefoil lectin domain protein n=1 Tax=Parvibaculum sp. TaxID=2024848 RepID=UPI003C70FFAF